MADNEKEMQEIMKSLQGFIKLQFENLQTELTKQVDKVSSEVQEHINNVDGRIKELDKSAFDQYCVIFAFKKLLIGEQAGTILNEKKFEEMVVDIAKASLALANEKKKQQQKEG